MKNTWKLDSFKVDFHKGWKHEKTEDRYEGFIKFCNEENESFTIKLDAAKSQVIMDLIADEIVKTASNLAIRMATCLYPEKEVKDEKSGGSKPTSDH